MLIRCDVLLAALYHVVKPITLFNHVEIGSSNVECMAFVVCQKTVKHIGHFMFLVVDNEWDGHDNCPDDC